MKKKIKVAHIITRLIVGGAQENTISTVTGLMKNPHYDVTLLSGPEIGPEGTLRDKAMGKGVNLIIISQLRRNLNPVRDLLAVTQLIIHFMKNRYDIIHTHSSKAGIIARISAFLTGCPVIIHTIHGLPFHPYQSKWRNILYIFLEKICAKITDKIITVSDTMRDKALEKKIGEKELYTTIYSGMDIDSFANCSKHRNQMRQELKIKPDELVVGKIARLFDLKGHDFVIDCAKEISKNIPNVKFLFVGDGILKDKLIEKIHSLGMDEKFIFTGLVAPEKIPPCISCMDILVHASLREGLARALPQAMAAGLPIVAIDVDSAHEMAIDNKTGFLIPSNDQKMFVQAVIKLLRDKKLRSTLGQNGKKMVIEMFKTTFMVNKIETLYEDLIICG